MAIPSKNEIDPDLLEMFSNAPNKAAKQTTTNQNTKVLSTPIDICRLNWSKDPETQRAYDYGTSLGKMGQSTKLNSTNNISADLIDGYRQSFLNELQKIGLTGESVNDVFKIIAHALTLLGSLTFSRDTENKFSSDCLMASLHGFIVSYVETNFKK